METLSYQYSVIEIVSQAILLISSLFVSSVCYFLYAKERNRSYLMFSLSFLFFFFGVLLDIASTQTGLIGFSYTSRGISLIVSGILYLGISGSRYQRVLFITSVLFVYTILTGILLPDMVFLVNTPAAVGSAVYLVLSAEVVYRKRSYGAARIPLAVFLFVWAAHKLDYPLMRYRPELSWLGYFVTTLILSGVVFSLLIAIYEQKRENLLKNLERLSNVVENLPVVLFEFSLEPLRLNYISPNVHSLLGYSAQKLVSPGAIWNVVEVENRQEIIEELKKSVSSQVPVRTTITVKDAVGARRIFDVVMRSSGFSYNFKGVASEITEEHETQQKLRQFEEAISELEIGFVLLNEDNELVFFNPFAGNLLNLRREQLGLKASELLEKNPLFAEVISLCATQKENIITVNFGKTIRYYRCESFDLRDEKKEIKGKVILLLDATEQEVSRRRQERFRVLEKVAESIATVLHDFNNILTAIIGNIEFVKSSSGLSSDERQALEDAATASRRAVEMAAELMEVSRPVRDVELEEETVSRFTDELLALFSHEEKEKIDIKVNDDIEFKTNSKMLQRAVFNILKNALEVSQPDSRVELEFTRKSQGNRDYLEISVKDYGPGMDPSTLEKIFLPFYSTKRKGVGLGLYIAFAKVRDLGGKIDVESVTGQGSRFSILIPLDE